ncbi:YihY/virulence factor BrkB family protein [Sulfitobacter sabulilitoris]|uniref:YihY/virulence factor BrkB family protein n=1 Tax=Sulfitobacter sabulilitoris TaxID=2562655 RepID=A0A5S3PGD8_9RHOB|nr:YihY/virulence factor BrkB family protein [Sulfitobacter sabulilitoris]TMM50600.1 YihY/virulence factor BrkB family protein [Sulfitobacter sabulilitoris]
MRDDVQPSRISVYWAAAVASFHQIAQNNLALIAAGVAFFSMLSIFPGLAALIAIMSLIADPVVVVAQLEEVRGLMPDDVYKILNKQVVGLVSTSSDTLGWAGAVSVLVAVWSARAGVGAMMNGLNAVYGERNRTSVRHYARALMMTLTLVGVGIVALLAVVVAPVALAFLPLGWVTILLADLLRWTIAIGVIFVGVGVLYRYGPNRKRGARMAWVTPGAVGAVVSWAVLSIAFSFYVANFGNYNEVYGSIGAVIAMLVWLWISSFLVLLGGAFNAELELRTKRDSTVGDARKPGLRGAYVADTVMLED